MTPVEAWSAVVSGEDAAVYAYSLAGALLPSSARRRALAGLDEHRSARSRAAGLVGAAGGTAPPAAATYTLPGPVTNARQARDLMAHVDNALVAVYADAAAASAGPDRLWAARTAAANGARAVTWGAPSQAFPS